MGAVVCLLQALGLAMWLGHQPGAILAPGAETSALVVLILTAATMATARLASWGEVDGRGGLLLASLAALVALAAPPAGAARPEALQLVAALAVCAGVVVSLVATCRSKQNRTQAEYERDLRRGGTLGTAVLGLALIFSGAPKGVENLADRPAAEARAKRRNDADDE